jgi:hypothetical protein
MSTLSLEEACHFMWREELTDWGEHKITNHIYISKGTDLMGYVARSTGVIHMFNTPKKSWSVSRRKFRKLNKKEIREIVER